MAFTSTTPAVKQQIVQQLMAGLELPHASPAVVHRNVLMADPYTTRSQKQLLSHIEDLVAAEHRKDESLALLLHELRTPLASIQAAVAVLRLRNDDETLRQRMQELVERQVRQIVRLTASLSQMSGSGPPDLQPAMARIDLCTVLWRAAESVTPEYAGRQQNLLVSVPGAGIWITGDASRLEQVFVNLLSNASKYSNAGDRIVMSLQACDGHALVQVSDSGIGIAADSLPFIFDLFVRADAAAVRTRPGTGVGLALVRSILEAHQGTVTAASAGIGQGSEFTVRLKLRE